MGEARRILNSFLVFLEQASPQSIIVAATNRRAILDHALFRRFDMVIPYRLPDTATAAAVMRARLGPLGKGIRWSSVTKHAGGLSHSDLVKAAETAAKQAVMRHETLIAAADLSAALDARAAASVG